MPVKKRVDKRRAQITDLTWRYLNDDIGSEDELTESERFELFILDCDLYNAESGYSTFDLWSKYKDEIINKWIKKKPGTRPHLWWQFDAPKISEKTFTWFKYHGSGQHLIGKQYEPRKRLGGVGTPAHEVLCVGSFDLGIPTMWVSQWNTDYYNGRAVDIHGKVIDSGFKEGDFIGVPIDPNDLPFFESQASYLKRHTLHLPGERKHLTKKDFEPEVVNINEVMNDDG